MLGPSLYFISIVIGRSQKSLSPMDAGTEAGRFPVADPKKLSPMDATMQFLDPKKLVKNRVLH